MSVNPEAVGDMPQDAADHMKEVLNSDRQDNGSEQRSPEPESLAGDPATDEARRTAE